MPPKQAEFSYNIAPTPAKPRVSVPAPQVPYVNPGGNLTFGEFNAGGARPNMYGMYDPQGAANVRAALPTQAAYTPGQYGGGSMGMRPALPPPSDMPLAVRPNMPPAAGSSMSVPTNPAMKPAQVLNVRTVPGTGGAAGAVPALGAGGSRVASVGGTVGKAIPFVGDVLQGAAYGYEGGSVGRGVAAGLGSVAGRIVGGAAGTAVAPGVGTAVGSLGGAAAGAYGAAKLYDSAFGEPEVAPLNEAQEFQKRKDMQSGDSPELRAARAQQTPAQLDERAEEARRDTRSNYPSYFEPAKNRQDPVVMKKDPSAAVFQGPSAEEMARFRKQTGTPYDPKSITDKLNLERMRAGEQTFTSKQSREFRKSNPTYRPGQYVKRG